MSASTVRGRGLAGAVLAAAMLSVTLAAPVPAQTAAPADRGAKVLPFTAKVEAVLAAAYERYRGLKEGANADYIPALAKVDPAIFGVALVTPDGKVHTAGDVASEVSIQSISKVFTLALVFHERGTRDILDTIGVEATGEPFNSITAIERHRGGEMNPLVNPGAIVTTSMVSGTSYDEIWGKILATYDDFAGRSLVVNNEVYASEAETNRRNQAIAMLMYAYGKIKEKPLQATDIYTRQCSVAVNARDLAIMAGTLANHGRNPVTGKQVLEPEYVPKVLAIMATAGLYDTSGTWLFETGLPAKSGVGGGLIAVSPGRFGIAAVSPPLDRAGNSVRAQRAIADISKALGGNPFAE